MRILLPQGIGDAVWGLLKVPAILKAHRMDGHRVDICINRIAAQDVKVDRRAYEFVRRFDFVRDVIPLDVPIHPPGRLADAEGRYCYIPDGPRPDLNVDMVLMPNAPLERGIRLEEWLPQFPPTWNIRDHILFTLNELDLAACMGLDTGYVVFYMSGVDGNSTMGHNRGPLWTPEEWIELGDALYREYEVDIVVVGAPYDLPYYDQFIRPHVAEKPWWQCRIGRDPIMQTFAIIMAAECVIAYPSGIGIVSHYLRKRVGMFWRPKGDSIFPAGYPHVTFEESMAHAWTIPGAVEDGWYLPLIYKRDSVESILEHIDAHEWIGGGDVAVPVRE